MDLDNPELNDATANTQTAGNDSRLVATTKFVVTAITNALDSLLHNSLGSIQGGASGQYNHITNAEYTVLQNTSGTNTGDQTITLTGDVTGSGTGSFPTTLATVNGNVGSFGSSTAIPNFTVNAKGLMTAAGVSAVIAPAGTLTGTTLASNVVNSDLKNLGIQNEPITHTNVVGDKYYTFGTTNGFGQNSNEVNVFTPTAGSFGLRDGQYNGTLRFKIRTSDGAITKVGDITSSGDITANTFNDTYINGISANRSFGIGDDALASHTSGFSDIGIGTQSLENLTSGNNVTAVGDFTGNALTTESNVALFGTGAGALLKGGTNSYFGPNVGNLSTTSSGCLLIAVSDECQLPTPTTDHYFAIQGDGTTPIIEATSINSTPDITLGGDTTISGGLTVEDGFKNATFYDATGGQTVSTGNIIINLDTTLTDNSGGDISLATDVVTLSAGFYLVTYSLTTTMIAGTRAENIIQPQLDAGAGWGNITGSSAAAYNRQLAGSATATGSITFEASTGDELRFLATSNVVNSATTVANRSRVSIVKLG